MAHGVLSPLAGPSRAPLPLSRGLAGALPVKRDRGPVDTLLRALDEQVLDDGDGGFEVRAEHLVDLLRRGRAGHVADEPPQLGAKLAEVANAGLGDGGEGVEAGDGTICPREPP